MSADFSVLKFSMGNTATPHRGVRPLLDLLLARKRPGCWDLFAHLEPNTNIGCLVITSKSKRF